MLPLLLAVTGLAVRLRREQIFFAVAGVAAALLVWVGPVAELFDRLPGYDSVNLWRSLILVVFCAAMLAAFGLQALLESTRRERLRMAAVMALVVGLVGGQWLVRHMGTFDELGAALRKLPVLDDEITGPNPVLLSAVLRWCLIGAVAAGLIALAAWRPRLAPAVAAVAVALAVVDLVGMGRGYHPAVDASLVDVPTPPTVRYLQRAAADGSRSMGEGFTWPANLLRASRPSTRASTSCRRSRKLFTVSPATDRLADLFAVRWLYSSTLTAAPRAGYRPVAEAPGVVENLDALPRAWVAHAWRGATGPEEAIAAVAASSSAQLFDAPVIEDLAPRPGGAAPAEPARVVSEEAGEVVLSADAGPGGVLVLADSFYPGWTAEVDGREAEIRPANAAFRAIALPPGLHEVRFAYESAAVRWGWIATLLGLAGAAGVGIAHLVRRRRSASS